VKRNQEREQKTELRRNTDLGERWGSSNGREYRLKGGEIHASLEKKEKKRVLGTRRKRVVCCGKLTDRREERRKGFVSTQDNKKGWVATEIT